MIAIALAAATVGATTLGGFLALRSKDRFHLVLGLAAGLMLGLVAFDLIPEIFANPQLHVGKLPLVAIAFAAGFLILHFLEQLAGTHEPVDSDFDHEHTHFGEFAGAIGATTMAGHVFMDGVAIAVAYKVSSALGLAVFLALLVHAFSDGLNTVAMLVKHGHWSARAKYLLLLDGIARIGGATFGTYITLSEKWIAVYLALFAGFVIYIATSHILPEAHSRHPSRVTMLATLAGVGIMWLVVATL
jgi:ZIP family zinc transporter